MISHLLIALAVVGLSAPAAAQDIRPPATSTGPTVNGTAGEAETNGLTATVSVYGAHDNVELTPSSSTALSQGAQNPGFQRSGTYPGGYASVAYGQTLRRW